MSRIRLFLIAILGLHSAFSWSSPSQKVVLFTSFDAPQILWHSDSQWMAERLESEFSTSFQNSGFEVEMIRQASGWQLHQALHDPATVGVFWVSHAGKDTPISGAMRFGAAIPTHDGFDIKSVFQSVGPQLKFLAVIGCSAQAIIDQARRSGAYSNNPRLKIVSFDHPIEARDGLTYALNESVETIADFSHSDYGPGEGGSFSDDWKFHRAPRLVAYPDWSVNADVNPDAIMREGRSYSLSITRTASQGVGELLILDRGKFLGILPPAHAGTRQSIVVDGSPARVQIIAHPKSAPADFSELHIRSSEGQEYAPLSVGEHIIGVDSQVWVRR